MLVLFAKLKSLGVKLSAFKQEGNETVKQQFGIKFHLIMWRMSQGTNVYKLSERGEGRRYVRLQLKEGHMAFLRSSFGTCIFDVL